MDIVTILLIIILLGVLPAWPYSNNWGYFPGGIVALVIILVLLGRL